MIGERIDKWKQDLLQQGMQQGKLEGLQQGEVAALKRLLTRRFGALSAKVEAQINQASQQQMEKWFDRGVDATNLAVVFSVH